MSRIYEVARRNNIKDPDQLMQAINRAINGLNPIAAFIIGSMAHGEFVMGMSDIDLVVIVSGEPPFRARIIGSQLGDVEIVIFTLDEFCKYHMDNNMMLESLRTGIPIIGDPKELIKQCK